MLLVRAATGCAGVFGRACTGSVNTVARGCKGMHYRLRGRGGSRRQLSALRHQQVGSRAHWQPEDRFDRCTCARQSIWVAGGMVDHCGAITPMIRPPNQSSPPHPTRRPAIVATACGRRDDIGRSIPPKGVGSGDMMQSLVRECRIVSKVRQLWGCRNHFAGGTVVHGARSNRRLHSTIQHAAMAAGKRDQPIGKCADLREPLCFAVGR